MVTSCRVSCCCIAGGVVIEGRAGENASSDKECAFRKMTEKDSVRKPRAGETGGDSIGSLSGSRASGQCTPGRRGSSAMRKVELRAPWRGAQLVCSEARRTDFGGGAAVWCGEGQLNKV